MAIVEQKPTDPVEAVIISGPRRGEIITLPESEYEFTPEEEALVDAMLESARRMEQTTREMLESSRALVRELRAARQGQ